MDLRLAGRVLVRFGSMGGAVLATLISFPPTLFAQTPPARSVRAITIAVVGSDAVVTIDADGPLPPPTVGAVDGPPRVFLDLAGVRTIARATTLSRDPRIRRVRVAIHSAQPLVTRVVLDLTALLPHRIEHAGNQIKVVVGTASATAPTPVTVPSAPVQLPSAAARSARAIVPVPSLPDPAPPVRNESRPPQLSPPPAATAAPAPVTSFKPPSVPPSLKDLERYRGQVLGIIERLRLQLPVLESLEDRSSITNETMELAMGEIDRLRQELAAVKPPDSIRVQHDLLLQSARMATMAIRMRAEALVSGNSTVLRNAASAAAGAVLMFDRACADVGCLNDRQF